MKKLSTILISTTLTVIGMTSIYMFIRGDIHDVTTWLWLLPAQIIMQPGFRACTTMASNIVGVDETKPNQKEDE